MILTINLSRLSGTKVYLIRPPKQLLEKVLDSTVLRELIDSQPILTSAYFASRKGIQEFVALGGVIIRLDESRHVSANRSRMTGLGTETEDASVGVKRIVRLSTQKVVDSDPSFWDNSPTAAGAFHFGFPTVLSLLVSLLGFVPGCSREEGRGGMT